MKRNKPRRLPAVDAVDLDEAMRDAKALPPPSMEVVEGMSRLFARRRRLPVLSVKKK